jgi:hypothetical protein
MGASWSKSIVNVDRSTFEGNKRVRSQIQLLREAKQRGNLPSLIDSRELSIISRKITSHFDSEHEDC